MDPKQNDTEIRTRPCPDCYLCGTRGKPLYQGLKDRLFGVKGEWDLNKCQDLQCGLVWLNPVPLEKDSAKAYEKYYTHNNTRASGSILARFYRAVRDGYLQRHFGYTRGVGPRWFQYLSPIAYMHPAGRRAMDATAMYLPAPKPGERLLEIGCGNGKLLFRMRKMGWEVEGLDLDLTAVEIAQKSGLKVHMGDLRAQDYPENFFDAIYMDNVIEHINDPNFLFYECYRILKPEGVIGFVTPNSESLGHALFKKNWFHLDPPRHLFIFNHKNLRKILEMEKFTVEKLFSTSRGGYGSWLHSMNIKKTGSSVISGRYGIKLKCSGIIFQVVERLLLLNRVYMGEELIIIARKRK